MKVEGFPLVSVICNCYNHAPYILEALESVARQSYKNIEIIVINNGSKDNSAARIKSFTAIHPKTVFIDLKESVPHTKAFNLGFAKSAGSFLVDLSGDDIILPQTIEKQVRFFIQQDSQTAIIFGNAIYIDENGTSLQPFFETDAEGNVTDRALFQTNYDRILGSGNVLCSVSAMMSSLHFRKLGGYDERLFFEDLDYWLRASYCYKIAFLDTILVKKRVLPSSLGSQLEEKNKVSDRINRSMRMIYRDRIKIGTPSQNRLLLSRIHYSICQTFRNGKYLDLIKYCTVALTCRRAIYFTNSKKRP